MLRVEILDDELDFFQNWSGEKDLHIVCPSPVIADRYRSIIDSEFKIHAQVITISKFMRDELSLAYENIETKRKSELMLELSIVFKKFLADSPKEYFFQAFKIFTELRSFTLDLNLVREVINEFDQTIAKAIEAFWLYVDQVEIVDEHKSYALLAEAYGDNEHKVHTFKEFKNVVFLGFQHLSALQLDLLKAYALRNDVFVPLDKYQYHQSIQSDWVQWLKPLDEKVDLNDFSKINVNLITFSKKRLAQTLKQVDKKLGNNTSYCIASRDLDYKILNELNINDQPKKFGIDPFHVDASKVFEEVEKDFMQNYQSINFEKLKNSLEESLKLELSNKEKNFKRIKVLMLVLERLSNWNSVSDINKELNDLDIEVLRQMTLLDLPRVYAMNLLGKENRIKSIDEIESLRSPVNCLIVSSSYAPLSGGDENYSEKIMEFLRSIGPIRRKDFEFNKLFKQIYHFLNNESSYLLVEEGLWESDLAWGKLFEYFDTKKISYELEKKSQRKEVLKISSFNDFDKSYSATKLQSYLDCPRKYYYSYIEKIPSRFEVKNTLTPDQFGILEHDVLEKFFKQKETDKNVSLIEVVRNVLNAFLASRKIFLSKTDYWGAYTEIRDLTQNAVNFIEDIIQRFDIYKFEFEQKITQDPFGGSIDFIGESSLGNVLIDFKRSSSSVPSEKEILENEKIQLQYYLKHSKGFEKILLAGFFCMKEPEESLLILSDKNLIEIGKRKEINEKHLNAFSKYETLESEIIENINKDKSFLASPKSANVCHYCSVSYICQRGELI